MQLFKPKSTTKNTEYDEAEQLLSSLDPRFSAPEDGFIMELREKVANPSSLSNIKSLPFVNITKRQLKMALPFLATALVVVILFVSGGAYFIFNNNDADKFDQEDILARIAQNNRSSRPAATNALAESDSGDEKLASTLIARTEGYSYSRTAYKSGPKIGSCSGAFTHLQGQNALTYENYEYYIGKENKYYGKSITLDPNNKVMEYYLSLPDSSYQYRGGSFAIKLKGGNQFNTLALESAKDDTAETDTAEGVATESNGGVDPEETTVPPSIEPTEPSTGSSTPGNPGTGVVPSEPNPDTDPDTIPTSPEPNPEPAPEPNIKDFFGENAKVIDEENGQYIITWEYMTSCELLDYGTVVDSRKDEPVSSADFNDKIVIKAWVDKDNFRFSEQEEYLGSISSDNLLLETKYSEEKSNVAFTQVADKFNFDRGVQVKEFDESQYAMGSANYYNALLTKLQTDKLLVLQPTSQNYKPTSFSSDKLNLPSLSDFFSQRSFYAPGAVGDKQYKEFKDGQNSINLSAQPEVVTSFNMQANSSYSDISVSVFNSSQTLQQILDNNSVGEGYKNEGSFTIYINNAAVRATLFSEDYSDVKDCPDCTQSHVLAFSHGGAHYILRAYGVKREQLASELRFTSLNANNASNASTLKVMYDATGQQNRDLIAY